MRYGVLAIDYDGTIASESGVPDGVRRALAATQDAGITVVLVTGRRLDELRRVAGDLGFADAVVAENGAVITFPASGRSMRLHGPPPPAFSDELRRRGVAADDGECVVETPAASAGIVLEVVRAMELPLVLAFNRARLMVLPQAVSKATGLREALATLRLSVHNTLAIGDAENDHALLEAAEVGVAVGWGSPALAAVADLVVDGRGPVDLAPFLQARAASRDLPATDGRRQVLLGHDEQRPIAL
ncbi:MAG: HAD family hydrolase, partial [Vicinamibacterales bacterium]